MYSLGVLLWEIVTSDVPERGRMRPVKVHPSTLCCAVLCCAVLCCAVQAYRVLLYIVTAGSLYFCECRMPWGQKCSYMLMLFQLSALVPSLYEYSQATSSTCLLLPSSCVLTGREALQNMVIQNGSNHVFAKPSCLVFVSLHRCQRNAQRQSHS